MSEMGIVYPIGEKEKMSVIRVNKTGNYTVMSNYHLQDKDLSLKAKGLLSVMLSLPDDWDYTVDGLVSICKENETAVKSTLKELKQFGYLTITKITPDKTESGRFEYVYNIFEAPQKKKQETKKQVVEILPIETLPVEVLQVENLPLNKYTNKQNTNKQNTKDKKDIYIVEQKEKTIPYDDIVRYLNEKIEARYRSSSQKTRDLIKARYNDGFGFDDFIRVIDNKSSDWLNDKRMSKFLRPETLFGTKFESYLNQKPKELTTSDVADKLDFSDFQNF